MRRAAVRVVSMLPAAAAMLLMGTPEGALAAALEVGPTTPPGITLVEVVRDQGGDQPVLLWYRPGDASGRTLFVFDQDRAGALPSGWRSTTRESRCMSTNGSRTSRRQ